MITSKSNYKNHRYSGPRKSRNRVRGALKRNHDGDVSRVDVWRKKRKIEIPQNEAAESAGQNIVKTYSRQVPVVHVEATFDAKSHQPSTSNNSKALPLKPETKALEINWPVTDPTLACHELTIEKSVDNNLIGLTGNRIVDIQHILHWAFALGKHTKTCANSTIEFVRELRNGFNSIFIFKCSMCDKEFRESNENSDHEKLNTGFVWGTVTGAGYYTQASHLTNVMDIPTMGPSKFRKIEKSLGDTWKDQLTEEIKNVGQQERAIAIEKGQITDNGIPYIEVEVDGGWAKRSYGHNYNSASGMILPDTKLPLYGRKMLKARLSKLTTISRKIILHHAGNRLAMRNDLQYGPSHVFGEHEKCQDYFCKYIATGEQDVNYVKSMKEKAPAVWAVICAANEFVITKTNRLSNDTTNHVENFMSIISKLSKFNCGKRLNLHTGGSYQRRVTVAGLSQVTGQTWHKSAWRKCTNSSPGKTFRKYIGQRQRTEARRKLYKRRRLFHAKPPQPDKNYGPEAQDTADPVNLDDLKKICADKLPEFNKTADEIKAIEESTIGQHENDLYNMYRSDRLTASQFGVICKRRKTTPSHNHVKQVLYKSNIYTKDMLYGQQNESVARTYFIENYKKTVRQAGLYIDAEFGFLGASPDGILVNEEAILEIKCFPSLARKHQDILSASKENKNFPVVQKNGILSLNEKHHYYYQVPK
ncbi:uncharacterized protein LOC134671192 [Cydia fagiglandana]|uniref:uncharacterized protein LOC134671192 n=1 Tax=Cydia fagiglandana TaxID=1458189 RepID=UPI002FEE516C